MAQRRRKKKELLTRQLSLKGDKRPAILLAAVLVCCGLVGALTSGQLSAQVLLRNVQAGLVGEQAIEGSSGSSGESGNANDDSGTLNSVDARSSGSGDMDAKDSEGAQDLIELEPYTVTVHVDGAVANPGVYEIDVQSPRINDAITAAGGLLDDAQTTGLNLASPLLDGEKIYVPKLGEEATNVHEGESLRSATSTNLNGGGQAQQSGISQLVNINTASASELEALPGIGSATAEAILKDRTTNGSFSCIEDLMRVSGIGSKKFQKLEGLICV